MHKYQEKCTQVKPIEIYNDDRISQKAQKRKEKKRKTAKLKTQEP